MDPIYQCKLKVGDRSFETYTVYKSHLDIEYYNNGLLSWVKTIILRNITSTIFSSPLGSSNPNNPSPRHFGLEFHMGGDQVSILYQEEDYEKINELREAVLDILSGFTEKFSSLPI